MADVVLHLAQTEEAVVATVEAGGGGPGLGTGEQGMGGGLSVDDAMEQLVAAERDEPAIVFGRWRAARRAAVEALQRADPDVTLRWAAAPLKPRTLATTRLAEHWAHALDITEPLAIPFPDTDRLRHIAWLGHASLPYAFALAGEVAAPVHCRLIAPSGATWTLGPDDAPSSITGASGAFCRVGAQRLKPEASGLETSGSHGAMALRVLRNYAA